MEEREKFFKCSCHGEGMFVTLFDDEENFYFSYWGQGLRPRSMSWWQRMRLCWKILRDGEAYEDEIILEKDKAGELAVWLNTEINRLDNEREKKNN